jgi:DNA repair exonuclease SbcCD ATPase subunit
MQELLKAHKEEWKEDNAGLEAKQRAYRDQWKKDVAELNGLAQALREEWQRAAKADAEKSRELFAGLEERAGEIGARIDAQAAQVETVFGEAVERVQGEARVLRDEWTRAVETGALQNQALFAGLEERAGEIGAQIDAQAAQVETAFGEAVERVQGEARVLRDEWKQAVETGALQSRELFAGREGRAGEIDARIDAQAAQVETAFGEVVERVQEEARALRDEWKQAAREGADRNRELLAGLERRVAEIRGQIDSQAVQVKTAFGEAMEQVRGEARTLRDEWKQASEAELLQRRELLAGLEGHIEDIRLQIDAQAVQVKTVFGETMEQVRGEARTLRDEWKQASEAELLRNRELLAGLEGDVEAIRGQIDSQAAQTQTVFGETMEQVRGEARALQEEWAEAAEAGTLRNRDLLAGLEAQAAEIRARIDAEAARVETAFGEATERVRGEARALHEEWAEASEAGVLRNKELFAELDRRVGEIRGRIEAQSAQLEASFGEAMEQVGGEARSLREEWKQAAREAADRNRELLADLEGQVRGIRNQIDTYASQVETVFGDAMSRAEEDARTAAAAELAKWKTAWTDDFQKWKTAGAGDFEKWKTAAALDLEAWKTAAAEAFERWRRTLSDGEAQNLRLFEELQASSGEIRTRTGAEIAAMEEKLKDFAKHATETFAALEARLLQTAEDSEQRVLEAADTRLEEYRRAQAVQYRQLEALADDSEKLDGELRRYMAETENRVREDFALFERDSAARRDEVAAAFAASVETLHTGVAGVEQELAALKERAYENVSEKLRIFEDDFSVDLSRRREEIGRQLDEWKQTLDGDLAALAEESREERRRQELAFSGELKSRLAEQTERLTVELERLNTETVNFEDAIRDQLGRSEQSLLNFREQLDRDLDEVRSAGEASVKAEIGRHSLHLAETLKQAQRDLAASLREIEEEVGARSGELSQLQEASRRELEEWQLKFAAQIRDADTMNDDIRRRVRELAAESDDRIAAVRSAIEEVYTEADSHRTEVFSRTDEQVKLLDSAIKDADRHIREFIHQTKLFEQTDALKLELERRIEDFRIELDRLDQRRSEIAELEGQFIKIRRLEDDINSKMTRFLSEQRRIDRMEEDFNRLLLTSQGVEEKLSQVSASDDTLQAIEVEIRKLGDALGETEERYQRIEKKNKTLEITNQGIDRNFQALRESEAALKRFDEDLYRLSQEQDNLRASLENLAAAHEKAQNAAEKVSVLDETLSAIEERITAMNVAREWLAGTETRLGELDKDIKERLKIIGNILKKEGGKEASGRKGAPPVSVRESAIKLARLGWSMDDIASSLKISRAEVELILEMGLKD